MSFVNASKPDILEMLLKDKSNHVRLTKWSRFSMVDIILLSNFKVVSVFKPFKLSILDKFLKDNDNTSISSKSTSICSNFIFGRFFSSPRFFLSLAAHGGTLLVLCFDCRNDRGTYHDVVDYAWVGIVKAIFRDILRYNNGICRG